MIAIVFGLIFQGAGVGLFYAMFHVSETSGIFFLLALGATASIGGFIMMLSGLRDYLFADLIAELRKISTNTVPKT